MALFEAFFKENYIDNLVYLTFGRYCSDNYGTQKYAIYNLTKHELFIDKRQLWEEKNKFGKTYTFRGTHASNEQFEIAKELLYKVPRKIYSEKLQRLKKNFGQYQDILIIELFDGKQKTTVLIDDYIIDRKKLPKSLRQFRTSVEMIIKKLEVL